MSNLTTLPKGDSAWLLRRSIQRIMQQVSVLETNIGASTTGNSANTQVIFNDNGTLRGDADFTFNPALNKLSVNNIEVATTATITGDLTVDTSTLKVDSTNNRVGIGTASPITTFQVQDATLTGAGQLREQVIRAASDNANNSLNSLVGFTFSTGSAAYTAGTLVRTAGVYGINLDNSAFGRAVGLSFYTCAQDAASTEKYRIDNAGVATWSNVGGVAGTAMTLNSTGLGVGGSPDTGLLTVGGTGITSATTPSMRVLSNKATLVVTADGATNAAGTTINYSWANGGQGPLIFRNASISNVMTLDASGNVGIGVTPSAWGGTGYKALQFGQSAFVSGFSGELATFGSNCYFDTTDSRWERITSGFTSQYYQTNGTHVWRIGGTAGANTDCAFTQAMTLDASGALLIGQTTAGLDAQGGFWLREASSAFGSSIIINHRTAVGTGNSYAEFTHNGIGIGSITQNGTTGVLYNISSDYRLKESVAPLSGGLARVSALKPSIYKWKSDGSSGEGFLAHELAEVVPFAVTGEKDAVNEDGSIKSQGIDMSRVVPILVAAIQELTARVQTLEAR